MHLKYLLSLHQYPDLISQNVLQMYFFRRNDIDLKYTLFSLIQQVEVYLKYMNSIDKIVH